MKKYVNALNNILYSTFVSDENKLNLLRAMDEQFESLTDEELSLMYTLLTVPYGKGLINEYYRDELCEEDREFVNDLYWKVTDEQNDRYRAENEDKIRTYYADHFEGKEWKDIDKEDWSFYSDWHKDVFGYRPHGNVCGEYVRPY